MLNPTTETCKQEKRIGYTEYIVSTEILHPQIQIRIRENSIPSLGKKIVSSKLLIEPKNVELPTKKKLSSRVHPILRGEPKLLCYIQILLHVRAFYKLQSIANTFN